MNQTQQKTRTMKKMVNFFLFFLLFTFTVSVQALENLTVLLDWFPNPDHATLFIAQELGFFKEQGLNVTLIGPADPSDPPKLVAALKADIAIDYEPQFIEQIDRGLPLLRIGTLIDQPLDCVVFLKTSSIHSIADLKNKKMGYSSNGMTSIILNNLLKKASLTLHDVQTINVHYNLTQALLTNNVDAVTGMMRNFELIQLDLAGHPANAFFPEKEGVPTYSELILVINKKNKNDPRLIPFLNALQKATLYVKSHPKETWISFVKNHPELNNELNRRAWLTTLPLFTDHPNRFNQKNWGNFANFMYQNKLIKQVQPIELYSIDLEG